MLVFDTHIHCLPGVDDGAHSIYDAVQMIRMGKENGIGAYICTPHSPYIKTEEDVINVGKKLEKLRGITNEELFFGTEIYITEANFDQVVDNIRNHSYYPMGVRSGCYMLEFDYEEKANVILDLCTKILNNFKYATIVIAHVERYHNINPVLTKLKSMNCKFQVNISSFTDDIFIGSKANTIELLKNRFVDFIGTDAHSSMWRPPVVADGLSVLKELLPGKELSKICYQNALDILFDYYDLTILMKKFQKEDEFL